MKYWESVVNEVTNRHDSKVTFCFTDMGEVKMREHDRKLRRRRRNSPCRQFAAHRSSYRLGGRYGDLYLTKREAEASHYLLKGYTIPGTGKELNLSPRTIEFYVKNMKLKIGVKTKDELMGVLRESQVLGVLQSMF